MNGRLGAWWVLLLLLTVSPAHGQVIEYMSNGMKYQTLTRSGVTIIFTHLPVRIHEYAVIQAAISNGSDSAYVIRPDDFSYQRTDSAVFRAVSSKTIIDMLMQKGNSSDVIKLVTTYEAGVYGNPHFKSNNGYEARRQAALAMFGTKMKAAAAANAVALGQTRLKAGDSTDGAVFFASEGKLLTGGRLVVRTNTDLFEFNLD